MIKKLLFSLAPLLVVAAFAMTSAAAQAQLTYGTCAPGVHSANCPAGEKFTAFTTGKAEKVTSKKVAGSGPETLTSALGTITCKSLTDKGTVTNVLKGGVATGTSELTLEFDECSTVYMEKVCPVQTDENGAGNIDAVVTDEVITATTVKVNIVGEVTIVFSGPPPTGCPPKGTEVGKVTGSATGTETAKTNVLKFSNTGGFLFNGGASTFTSEDELVTSPGGLPVYI